MTSRYESLISVIVPVYKVEPYLDRCLQSIVDQTYTKLEIILVDDGSPDNCSAMCDAWAGRDKRIRVIHQENSGGGSARNRALAVAQGEFIAFVDSDDYIAPGMYAFLLKQFRPEIDIVECGFCAVKDDAAIFDSTNEAIGKHEFGTVDAMREHIRDHWFRQVIWNKLYRRHSVEGVLFPVGTKIDDEFWTYRAIGNAAALIHTDNVLYAYRQQGGSVMHQLSGEKRMQAIDAKLERHEYIKNKMPSLEGESLIGLWFTFLYQGQLALRTNDEAVWSSIREKARKYPLGAFLPQTKGKTRLWLTLACLSFPLACRFRNLMRIGL